MPKRILVIPDVHGETFWKEPVEKYKGQVDRIIFLGDYLDPYRDKFGLNYDPEAVFNYMVYEGQNMLAIVGRCRSIFGEKTGSILWADIEEHSFPKVPKAYGLNKVFQVIGHSRLNEEHDKIEFEKLVLIDSRQCFMIDAIIREKIVSVREFEKIDA